MQCHKQVACQSPVCSFQDQERRRRQWQRGQGSCRRPRRGTGRGTWGGRSRWTWPRSWECQELHMRMCPPDLLNQINSAVQRKWFYLWFQQPHYSMDAGTTQLPERSKRRNMFFRKRILVQAQLRSGRRRSHIWARCMSLIQGMKPERRRRKGRCERNDVFKELENERRRFCWKPLPPNKWQVGVHKGNLLLWASRCDTWQIIDL